MSFDSPVYSSDRGKEASVSATPGRRRLVDSCAYIVTARASLNRNAHG